MVMELLHGESLADRQARERRLSPEQMYRILTPCMEAVAFAHAAGVIHRDLKPQNIFLCKTGAAAHEQPKVLDFGISKTGEGWSEQLSALTRSGELIGTVRYMSLEQLRGKPVDERTDVYAFGVIMYELLSSRFPFEASTLGDLAVQLASDAAVRIETRLPDIPPALAELIHRALARDPERRFQSVPELLEALQACAADCLSAAAPLSAAEDSSRGAEHRAATVRQLSANTPSIPPARRTRRWQSGLLVSAVLLVAGGMALQRLLARQSSEARPETTAVQPLTAGPAQPRSAPVPQPTEQASTQLATIPQPRPAAIDAGAAQQPQTPAPRLARRNRAKVQASATPALNDATATPVASPPAAPPSGQRIPRVALGQDQF
ncbi:MAG TPA: protein kinase, partial [Polyangiales bacterium]|nr:protein kinase [Polyangiales bacterium]